MNSNYVNNVTNMSYLVDNEGACNTSEKKKKVSFGMAIPPTVISEKELNCIFMEHCYSRPYNRILESRFLKPTKTLFIPQKSQTKRKSTNPLAPFQDYSDVIDVEELSPDPPTIYDLDKVKHLMEECERHASFARIDDDNDWEEKISRINWLPNQNRLFNGVVNILNSDYMARLANVGVYNEPILRRNIIDKSVQRFRQLMSMVAWDMKLTQWLHILLIDNLSTSYLAIYFDILQTLKSKLPSFVDKMMYGPVSANRIGVTSNESLYPLLKRPWDPVAPSLSQDKPKKLPGNPVIIIVPTAPVTTNVNQFKRLHRWVNLLSNLTTVVTVYTNIGTSGHRMTMTNCLDQMFAATRTKIQEVKEEYPGRSLILAGFNAGAALALQVAQVEPIMCVLCLGFSLLTAEGKRGDPDDNLLELQCPVLFVIGQCSNTSLQEDLEDLRERMRVETGLIVVGSADDYLRVNKKKKRAECITQSVVDRCIVDEVGEFVSGLLLSPYPPQIRQSPSHVPDTNKCTIIERKRNNSNGSSVDSEPSSPTPRITRPVGRPPGSKSKMKPKWNFQMSQGIPSTPPPSDNPSSPTNLNPSDLHSLDTKHQSDNISSKLSPVVDLSINNKFVPLNSGAPEKSTTDEILRKTPESQGRSACNTLHVNPAHSQMMREKQGNAGIKVLENLTLNSSSTGKFLSSSGRAIDLSKITILNSVSQSKASSSYGNVVILPDGKIKSANPMIKGNGNTPLMLPMPNKEKMCSSASASAFTKNKVTKYITSKKQLMGTKPPKPTKKIPYISTSNLPLATNLTSQDIMDLPIIFADDNQMLTDSVIQPSETVASPMMTPMSLSKVNNSGKIVFVNKQMPVQTSSNVFSPSSAKRQGTPTSSRTNSNSVKYAKIILSKRLTNDETKVLPPNITGLSPEISIKKIDPQPSNDIESQLVATSLPNPKFTKADGSNSVSIKKTQEQSIADSSASKALQIMLNEKLRKRANSAESENDQIPAKSLKMETVSPDN